MPVKFKKNDAPLIKDIMDVISENLVRKSNLDVYFIDSRSAQ